MIGTYYRFDRRRSLMKGLDFAYVPCLVRLVDLIARLACEFVSIDRPFLDANEQSIFRTPNTPDASL